MPDAIAKLEPAAAKRLVRRRRARRRRGRRRLLGLVALLLLGSLGTVAYSYVSTVTRPSSVPLSIRSVEWLRANGGAWLVNDIESTWYRWHAPRKGGPALTALPPIAGAVRATARRRAALLRASRPPAIATPIRPRLPGEAVWQGTGIAVNGLSPVRVTAFRPQADYPRLLAYVGWIDHRLTRLALYPGRYEPPSAPVRGPMSVPHDQRWRLLATFNSGFTYRDGHGGFIVNGRVYEPLRDGLGTLVAYRDGTVDVRTWHGPSSGGAGVVLARQNLQLIVEGGHLGAALDTSARWGATLGNAVQVWRSAVGVDRHGNLLYAAANDQTVTSLAQLMIRVGALRAIELDINAEWPSFIGYGRRGARDPVKLVPNGMQGSGRYLSPDDRDFFAVYTRAGGGPGVPLG